AKDKDIIKKVYFNGKIYNEESEIIVLPSYVLKNFDSLKLNLKIKNLNLNKNSFVGDLVLNIENINKNFVDSKLEINNLWINNYFVGKAIIEMSYNSKQKTLDFIVDDKLHKRTDVLKVRGSVIFAKNNTRFKNLKLYIQESQYIFLNGNLGNNGDILDVKFFNIPIEILNSILRFSEPDIVGFVYGDVNIKTISSFDKDYKIDANFVAKDVNFKMAKIPEVLLNLVYEKEKVILEKLIFNFIDKGKIEAKGFYNVSSKNCDFVVKSIKCNLSILDNFYDIVKSAEGSFITELSIKGKINNPQIKGYFYLPKGNLKFKKYISYLNNTTIKLNFLNDKIEVEKFHGYCKDTKLIVSGIWSFSDTAKLKIFTQGGKGVEVFVYELSFPKSEFLKFVQDTSLYPSRGDMHFDLYITKQKDGIPPKVEGKIILNNTHFTYPGVKKYYITPEVRNLYYDITIVAKDNVWYSNELISANIVGSVNLNYTKLNTKTDINGEAIALSGNMKFLNTNFRIKSGQIQIIKRIPYLELIGETEAIFSNREKMKVQLIVDRSQIEDIKPRLISTSHPTLKSEDIASILLNIGELQKTEKEDYVIAKEQLDFNSLLRTQFIRLIDSTLATPIARGILQKWGIVDNITISQLPSGVAAEKQTVYQSSNGITKDTISFIDIIKNTKYGIEKYITSDMILSYSVALAEYQQKLNLRHELEIGYRLKGNVFIKGIYDYGIRDYNTGRYGGDIKIQVEPVFRLKSWAEEEKE
ncbi:MAG: translocation/assembly module TamB domain-containing protein, partial [Endomicrobiia bacterium]